MQLTCPNCSARYLVDPVAIGPTGRMVQCFRCGHQWQASPPPLPVSESQPAPPPVVEPPTPDFVIRPQNHTGATALPAVPADPGLPRWLRAVITVLVMLALIGGGSYLLHDRVIQPLVVDQQSAKIGYLPESDGKTVIVVTGDIINTGRSETAATRLHLSFKDAGGNLVAERAVEIATGRIPPNGRAKFEARIENPPASAQVDLAAE